jgi:hypothetical protein
MGRESPENKRKKRRHTTDILDAATQHLAQLLAVEIANQASGRFGIMVLLDGGRPTGIRRITDEAITIHK